MPVVCVHILVAKRVQRLVAGAQQPLEGLEIMSVKVNGPDGNAAKTRCVGVLDPLPESVLVVVAHLLLLPGMLETQRRPGMKPRSAAAYTLVRVPCYVLDGIGLVQ